MNSEAKEANMQRKNTQVYVVHLWKETSSGTSWRGRIQNVRTGQSRVAADLDELVKLFNRYFREESKPRPPEKKGLK
jgi:hypothetical protein